MSTDEFPEMDEICVLLRINTLSLKLKGKNQ